MRRIAALIAAISCCQFSLTAEPMQAPSAEHDKFFTESILPILDAHCFKCHGEEKAKGGLRLHTRASLVRGGDSGSALDLKTPDASLILDAVRYESYEMPPSGQLPKEQIDLIARWVALGAPYPERMLGSDAEAHAEHESPGTRVTDQDKQFWSFQPIARSSVPLINGDTWSESAVDRFIYARLAEKRLQPSEPADPVAVLRRVSYDLTGLPPTPEQVARFKSDPSGAAYERIVDELLASPEYGERWGRHWMDLVRYGETNSYERDGPKPEVWRYRDYVIDSLNAGKSFDQFATEQIAGDEMEFSPERLIATGFNRLGIWDDEPADPELALYDDLDDIVATTSQVFLGLTVNCARCHEHKIDPIPHADYYRLLAFYSGLNRFGVRGGDSVKRNSIRPLVPFAQGKQYTEAMQKYERERNDLNRKIHHVENKVRPDFKPVEHEEFRHDMNREPIVKQRIGKLVSKKLFEEYVANRARLKEIERDKPDVIAEALCVTEIGSQPRETFVLTRGNPHAKADRVEPGFLEVLGGGTPDIPPSLNPDTSGRRLVLADWITSDENPLTARVMANRLWQFHFGRGIVRTSNDFGFQGAKPTHPELLDFLASELIAHDWHLKPMHRMLVTSKAYRMASIQREDAYAVDPTNDLFWRFESRRLSAEEIRDSMLAATGRLNLSKGGPSIYPIIEKEVLAGQSRPGAGWGNSNEAERSRRSVYIHIKRSLPVPLMANFDSPDPDFTCPVRFVTIQPTQALGMLNSEHLREQARRLAEFVNRETMDKDVSARVSSALERVTQRAPSGSEVAWGVDLINQLQREDKQNADRSFELFCLVALNLNEFMYLD